MSENTCPRCGAPIEQARPDCPVCQASIAASIASHTDQEKMTMAHDAVKAAAGSARMISDRTDCPVCRQRGSLTYIIHMNGQTWGRCTTTGCVTWTT